MGIPEADDEAWAALMKTTLGSAPDLNPGGIDEMLAKDIPEVYERCRAMIDERRENPTEDLTSVLVHAEIEGQRLTEDEIVMGFFLLVAAGNDSTKATYTSGMRALIEHPDQRALLLEDPSLVPGAVEESLRMFPAFAHFGAPRPRTPSSPAADQQGRQGLHVVRVEQPRREPFSDPDRFDVRREGDHQAFGAGGRHFASAPRWPGWSCGFSSRRR